MPRNVMKIVMLGVQPEVKVNEIQPAVIRSARLIKLISIKMRIAEQKSKHKWMQEAGGKQCTEKQIQQRLPTKSQINVDGG